MVRDQLTKEAGTEPENNLIDFVRHVRDLSLIVEAQVNKVIQACVATGGHILARRQATYASLRTQEIVSTAPHLPIDESRHPAAVPRPPRLAGRTSPFP